MLPQLSEQPTVSVIILNWNGLHHLKTYLPSVTQTRYENIQLILADNNSDDDSIAWTKEHYPDVHILKHEQNFGYCKGNNLAAEQAEGDILVFLNNDVRTEPDWIEHMVSLFKKYPKLAAVQPKVLSDRNPDFFEYAGAAGGQLDTIGYPWCRGRIFETVEKDQGQYDDFPNRIFWASGAAMCIRKDVFSKTGGFDDSFGMHMEEIDLCWRLQRMGYEIRFSPEAKVYHLGGGTLQQGDARKYYYNFRNSLAMLAKNQMPGELMPVLFKRLAFDSLAGLRFLFSGDLRAHLAVWRAYRDFYLKLPKWLEIRGELQDTIGNNSNLKGYGPNSIAWEYYVRGRRSVENSMPFSIVLLTFFSATRSDRGAKEL